MAGRVKHFHAEAVRSTVLSFRLHCISVVVTCVGLQGTVIILLSAFQFFAAH